MRGKNILITGSTGELGQALSKKLARQETTLFLIHKTDEGKEELERELKLLNENVYFFKTDLTKKEEIDNTIKKILDIGEIDILINSLAIHVDYAEIISKEWEDYQKHLEIQVKSVFELCKLIIPIMKREKKGKIINVVSEVSMGKPPINRSDYIVSKYALLGFSKCLAAEYGKYNITCNCVSSGMMDTSLTSRIPNKLKTIIAYETPMKRICTVRDVVGVINFLCSNDSNFVNGENISVNGGYLMK